MQRISVLLGGLLALALLSWFCVKQHAESIAAKRAGTSVTAAPSQLAADPTVAPQVSVQSSTSEAPVTSSPTGVPSAPSAVATDRADSAGTPKSAGTQSVRADAFSSKDGPNVDSNSTASNGKASANKSSTGKPSKRVNRKSLKAARVHKGRGLLSEPCPSSANSSQFAGQVCYLSGNATLSTASKQTLAALAPALRVSGQRIQIIGYADVSGSSASNLALSTERARAVAKVLEQNGVAVDLMDVRGMGEEGTKPGIVHRRVDIQSRAP